MKDSGKRLVQQEKSRLMRLRLINATLKCLEKFGYHGASLSRILDEAGVSRGAWRHHYKTKNDLVAAASEYLLSTATEKARSVAPQLAQDSLKVENILEYIWEEFYQGPYRDIWIEFNIACRTDTQLHERLTPVIRNFFDEMDRIWETYLGYMSRPNFSVKSVMNLSLYLMRGMAIQSISLDDPEHFKEMRAQWSRMVHLLLEDDTTRD